MHHTADAGHLCGNRRGCLKGTRRGVLKDIEDWFTSNQGQRVFWLNGLAGTGKSAIAQTFAETAFAEGKLGASFFCSRDFADRSNPRMIFPTLAFQLACQYLPFRGELLRVLKARLDVGRQSPVSQMEELLVGPLKATAIQTLIIIDGLDECQDQEPASTILSALSRYVAQIPNVKFFITGRPEPRIRSGFRLMLLAPITEVLKLHEVKPEVVDSDIKLLFKTQLASFAKNQRNLDLTEDWPTSSDINILCKKAAGFFICASSIVKSVTSNHNSPTEKLSLITSLPQSTIEEGKFGVDQLYTKALQQAFSDDAEDSQQYLHFQAVVGIVLLTFNPLSIKGILELLGLDTQYIRNTIHSLRSLLLVPESTEAPICTFHKSFPDFLMDPDRCKDKRLFVEPTGHHVEILLDCLRLMEKRLKKNICDLDDYATLSGVKDLSSRQKEYIGDALEYACQFWAKHLLEIPTSSPHVEEVHEAIDNFFVVHLLHWIEVLVLTGNVGIGIYIMNDIEKWYNLVSSLQFLAKPMLIIFQAGVVSKWTNDSKHSLLEHFDTIKNSPSHIYHSALPLSPSSSWFHKYYSTDLSLKVKVVKGLPAEWGMHSHTVLLGSLTKTLSCWNNTVAVGSEPGDIIILDINIGSQLAILSGHTGEVNCLAFSSDGTSLVSGGDDHTVKLWHIQASEVIKTFGHPCGVWSVSISADCAIIASGSIDSAIRLWDIQTGECQCVIKQQYTVDHVGFSPTNPHHLISISGEELWQWDTNGHQISHPSDGYHFAFSLDGTQFVSCYGAVVTVQNSDSGAIVAKFQVANDNTHCCCFSPDGMLVAIASDSTIYIWDIASPNPHLVETFMDHTKYIICFAFSSSSTLISAFTDKSVKFWQISAASVDPVITNPEFTPITLPLISSISLQARDGIAISSDADGVVKTWDIPASLCKVSSGSPTQDCKHGDIELINSRLVFVWYGDGRINIWDPKRGKFLLQADISEDNLLDLRISGDGSKIFCINGELIQVWDMWTGEAVGRVRPSSYRPRLLAMDGSKVWIEDGFRKSSGWDFGTQGSPPVKLFTLPSKTLHLNDTKLWDKRQCKIQDTVTGNVVFQLSEGFQGHIVEVQWNGQYLAISPKSKMELVLELPPVFLQ